MIGACYLTIKQLSFAIVTSSPLVPSKFRRRDRSNLEPIMKSLFIRFLNNQSGATAIEYGLIAALIAVVCITTLTTVGSKLNNKFTSVSNGLN